MATTTGTSGFKGNVHHLFNSSSVVLPSLRTWRTYCALSSSDASSSTTPALALRLQAPFGSASTIGDGGKPLHSNPAPPRKKGRRKKSASPPVECSEQWQFLKMLPNQRIRDIAFVVASPATFSDSDELPLVSKDIFGDDESWPVVANWLKSLDAREVSQWFEGRRYTTRLGDHFAAFVEYILKFSPLVQPEPLFISQQILGCTIPNPESFRTLKVSTVSQLGRFEVQQGCVVSEVIVRPFGNDILVKRFGSYHYNGKGRVRNIPDSKIDSLLGRFKNSPFDYHGLLQTPTEVPQADTQNGYPYVEGVASYGLCANCMARKVYKWRVHYTTFGKDDEVCGSGHVHASAGTKSGAVGILMGGSETNSVLNPRKQEIIHDSKAFEENSPDGSVLHVHATLDRALLKPLRFKDRTHKRKESITRSVSAPSKPASSGSPASPGKALQKRALNSRSRMEERVWLANVLKEMKSEKNMAGECDFLFKANATKLRRDPPEHAWTEIHHWEVCMHFLSYVGPWEAFGLVTPGSAVWHQSGKRVFAAMEGLDPDNMEMYLPLLHDLHKNEGGDNQYRVLDGCFIAATLGDTWFDRKRSLATKLQICGRPNMAAKISALFHSSLRLSSMNQKLSPGSQVFCPDNHAHAVQTPGLEPLCAPHSDDYGKYRYDPSIIRVIPRALTKGYLFYEPKLWLALSMRRKPPRCECPMTPDEGSIAECVKKVKTFSTSSLSADHWIGWWVYARDFADFAQEYGREKSMWYVAPRHEWLSPIIIGGMERHRISRVLDLVGFMAMLLKVGEEGAALNPPRQRRFLAVEVSWDPDMEVVWDPDMVVCMPSCKAKGKDGCHDGGNNVGAKGGWVEVSRGFVVETTWPESRLELAHGFNLSWSPALLGWT